MASSYTGVSFHKGHNAWEVKACHGGKKFYLGYHATEMEAARKYDEWAMQIPGKPLNFPGSRPKRKIADLREKVYSTVRQNLIEDCKKEMAFKTAPEFLSFCDAFSGSKKGSSVTTSLGSGGFSAIDDDEVRWLQENGISFTANNEKAKRPPPRDRSKQPPRRRPLIPSSSTASSLSSQPSTLESRRVQKAPLQKKRKRTHTRCFPSKESEVALSEYEKLRLANIRRNKYVAVDFAVLQIASFLRLSHHMLKFQLRLMLHLYTHD